MPPSTETYKHARTLGRAARDFLAEEHDDEPLVIVDVGTGSGVVPLTIARQLRDNMPVILGTDVSHAALEVAKANAEENNITGVSWVQMKGLSALKSDSVDVVFSNPPYMSESASLERISRFVPRETLVAGETGLEVYEELFEEAQRVVKNDGVVVVQHPDYQRDDLVHGVIKLPTQPARIVFLHGNRQTATAVGDPTRVDILRSHDRKE